MLDFLKKLKDVFVNKVPDSSPTGKVDKTDLAKVTRNALLVALAAGLSYVIKDIDPELLGQYQPFIMLGLTAALDFINKLVKKNDGE